MTKDKVFEIQAVTHRPDLITFSWTDLGSIYKVYRGEELLYEGEANEFTDDDFTHAKLYAYTIEQLSEGKVINVIALQTSAFAKERNSKNPLQSLVMTTIVAPTQIALSWEEIPNVEAYEISRNGEFMDTVKGNSYIDRNFSIDESYVYKIHSKRPIEESPEMLSSVKSFISSLLGIFKQSKSDESPTMEQYTVLKFIENPKRLITPILERNTPENIDKWTFRYTTFLHDKILENPNKLSGSHYFKGDDRGFDPEGETFRTRVTIALDYKNSETSFDVQKKVGETIGYDLSKKVREKDTASDEGIEIERLKHKEGEEGFLLDHSVGNPLVSAPTIDYDVQAVLRTNRTFDVTGYHDQAPNHEVYLARDGDGSWFPIHQEGSEGLMWMSGVTGWQYWRASNFD